MKLKKSLVFKKAVGAHNLLTCETSPNRRAVLPFCISARSSENWCGLSQNLSGKKQTVLLVSHRNLQNSL